MKTFKEQAADDLGVFLNADEFAEEHDLNGTVALCVVERQMTEEKYLRSAAYIPYDGIYGTGLIVYVECRLLPEAPVEGMQFTFDGKIMLVDSCAQDMGLFTIVLKGHDS